MYRAKIRDHFEKLSRSYRLVADYIMSNYYEVSFMTAAQLADAVGVDTTTVVRFSQKIEYDGYPELLADIREQVRTEIYAAYRSDQVETDERTTIFKQFIEQEQHNLAKVLTHNPAPHIAPILDLFDKSEHILLMGEGYAETVVQMAAEQFRHCGRSADAVTGDSVKRAASLANLTADTLVIGVSATDYGRDVAQAMAYARRKGCATIGLTGSLQNPINRIADRVIYAPASTAASPLPSVGALIAALSALVYVVTSHSAEEQRHAIDAVYHFLTQPEIEAPDDDVQDSAGKR
jgi:DNA-binding MurR/RpiR family transcriptional regulator